MLLPYSSHHHFYGQLLSDATNGASAEPSFSALLPVSLFVAPTADALSASRILTHLLRRDGITYNITAVGGWTDLQKKLRALDDTRAIAVCIGCGATRNLSSVTGGSFSGDGGGGGGGGGGKVGPKRVYVVDGRRPIHLRNVYADTNVVVLCEVGTEEGSGEDGVKEYPSDGDDLSGEESSDDEEDEDGEEEEDDEVEETWRRGEDEVNVDAIMEGEEEADLSSVRVGGLKNWGNFYDSYLPIEEDMKNDENVKEDEDELFVPPSHGDVESAFRRPTSPATDAETPPLDDDGDEHADEIDGNMSSSTKRRRLSSELSAATESPANPTSYASLAASRRQRIRTYYSRGSSHGLPPSYILHRIADGTRHSSHPDVLWWAAIGLAEANTHGRLDSGGYEALSQALRSDLGKIYPMEEDSMMMQQSSEDLPNTLTGKILCAKEHRLYMLRHWSLYEALYHSSYVSTKWSVWTEGGERTLREMVAGMGVPLEEARQRYAFMRPVWRRRLGGLMEVAAKEYGLNELTHMGFFRVTGYRSLLSATDAALAITALLESPAPSSGEDGLLLSSFHNAMDALGTSGFPGAVEREGSDVSTLVNGNLAANATRSSNANGGGGGCHGMSAGIRRAMSSQAAIVSTAVALVEKNAIVRLKEFRFAYLHSCGVVPPNHNTGGGGQIGDMAHLSQSGDDQRQHYPLDRESEFFSHPLALHRLAHFLMDMHRENGRWTGPSRSLPLVLAAERPVAGTYLVAGYNFPERHGDVTRNRFGPNFDLAAKSLNGKFLLEKGFDGSVAEVGSDIVQRFIEQLHYLMDTN